MRNQAVSRPEAPREMRDFINHCQGTAFFLAVNGMCRAMN